jgi:hypothetical protein
VKGKIKFKNNKCLGIAWVKKEKGKSKKVFSKKKAKDV